MLSKICPNAGFCKPGGSGASSVVSFHTFDDTANAVPTVFVSFDAEADDSSSAIPTACVLADAELDDVFALSLSPVVPSSTSATFDDEGGVLDCGCLATEGDKHFDLAFSNEIGGLLVTHNLNKKPNISVANESGDEVVVGVDFLDLNTVQLLWNGVLSGTVYCN